MITIVTPTLNAEKFIEACIENVQSQSYKNVEHIIIDGNSSDRTVEIVRRMQDKYDNIKFRGRRHKGIYEKMNDGIDMASGEWIYFMGADDRFASCDALSLCNPYLRKSEAMIVYGNAVSTRFKGLYDGKFGNIKMITRNICHQAIFYRKAVFRKMGYYREKYELLADHDFNIRCWLSGKIKHEYIPVVIAEYADGGASSIRTDHRFQRDYLEIIRDGIVDSKHNLLYCLYILIRANIKFKLRERKNKNKI